MNWWIVWATAAVVTAWGMALRAHGRGPTASSACAFGNTLSVEGTVLRSERRAEGPRSLLWVTGAARVPRDDVAPGCAWRARLLWVRGVELGILHRVRLLVRPRRRAVRHNMGHHPEFPFDWGPHRADRVASSSVRVLNRFLPGDLLLSLRRGTRARCAQLGEGSAPDLCRALVLGESGALDDGTKEAVRRAGVVHLLVVSGLHAALVGALLVWVLCTMAALWGVGTDGRGLRVTWLMAALAMVVYVPFAGAGPSVLRAGTAFFVTMVLRTALWPAASFAVHGAVILGLVLFHPPLAWDLGFLLSCAATLAIVAHRPALAIGLGQARWWSRMADTVRGSLVVSLRAWVATLPIVLWCFGEASLTGAVCTLLLAPLAVLLLVGSLVYVSPAGQLVGSWGVGCLRTLSEWLVRGSEFGSGAAFDMGWQWALPQMHWVSGLACAMSSGAALFLLRPGPWGRFRGVACAALLCGVVGVVTMEGVRTAQASVPRSRLQLRALDVGQGDGLILHLPDGAWAVVDVPGVWPENGDERGGGHGGMTTVRALQGAGVNRVDHLVVTHGHPDHAAGVTAVLSRFEVGTLWVSGQGLAEFGPQHPWVRTVNDFRARGGRVRTPQQGCAGPWAFGGALVQVLHPCPEFDAGFGHNDNSLVLRVTHGTQRVLLTGDVESLAEAQLLRTRESHLRAEVLKVAHHGSRTSSTGTFLRAVRPRWAVISAGRHNRFGHPHRDVVHRLVGAGARVFLTSKHGEVRLTTDGSSWHLELARAGLFEGGASSP